MLDLNLSNEGIFNRDIFSVLGDYCQSSSTMRAYRLAVFDNVKKGTAVSIELGLLTGVVVKKRFGSEKNEKSEKRYVTHWTPVKDVEGRTKYIILCIAPKALEDVVVDSGLGVDDSSE